MHSYHIARDSVKLFCSFWYGWDQGCNKDLRARRTARRWPNFTLAHVGRKSYTTGSYSPDRWTHSSAWHVANLISKQGTHHTHRPEPIASAAHPPAPYPRPADRPPCSTPPLAAPPWWRWSRKGRLAPASNLRTGNWGWFWSSCFEIRFTMCHTQERVQQAGLYDPGRIRFSSAHVAVGRWQTTVWSVCLFCTAE